MDGKMTAKEMVKRMKRKEMGLRELARKTGIDVSTISRILSGETKSPLFKTVEKIRGVLR